MKNAIPGKNSWICFMKFFQFFLIYVNIFQKWDYFISAIPWETQKL